LIGPSSQLPELRFAERQLDSSAFRLNGELQGGVILGHLA
jgi:hypothetical protein